MHALETGSLPACAPAAAACGAQPRPMRAREHGRRTGSLMRNRLLPCQCKGAARPLHQAHAAPWAPDPHARGSAPGHARARPRPQPAAPRRGAPPPRLPQTPWARAPGAHMHCCPPCRHEPCSCARHLSTPKRWAMRTQADSSPLAQQAEQDNCAGSPAHSVSCGAGAGPSARALARQRTLQYMIRDRCGVGYVRARGAPLLRVLLQAHERVAEPQDLPALGLDQRQQLGPAAGAHIACTSGRLPAAAPAAGRSDPSPGPASAAQPCRRCARRSDSRPTCGGRACGQGALRAAGGQTLAWCAARRDARSRTTTAGEVRAGAARLRGCKQGDLRTHASTQHAVAPAELCMWKCMKRGSGAVHTPAALAGRGGRKEGSECARLSAHTGVLG